jgi:hypothetical protein
MPPKRRPNTKNEENYVCLPPSEDLAVEIPRVVLLNGDFSVYLFKTGPYICGHCGRISRSMNSLSAHFQGCEQAKSKERVMPTIELIPIDTRKEPEVARQPNNSLMINIGDEEHDGGNGDEDGGGAGDGTPAGMEGVGSNIKDDGGGGGNSEFAKVKCNESSVSKGSGRRPLFGTTRNGKRCNRCIQKGKFCFQHSPK